MIVCFFLQELKLLDNCFVDLGKTNIMEILIKAGANVNSIDIDGMTPLLDSARENHLEGFSLLLKQKANPNHANLNNMTALHYAAFHG